MARSGRQLLDKGFHVPQGVNITSKYRGTKMMKHILETLGRHFKMCIYIYIFVCMYICIYIYSMHHSVEIALMFSCFFLPVSTAALLPQ